MPCKVLGLLANYKILENMLHKLENYLLYFCNIYLPFNFLIGLTHVPLHASNVSKLFSLPKQPPYENISHFFVFAL